ncbi:hypothetical protein NA57DRAFT_58102 [Rhizodiscina lignyota]|uniref:Uncharacterized protein n=1 Tax=Rhizodiscina lignyota TaxID=1504668 RepID=A0A9P4M982_9PEZI|nr:hypothetical protein NA57DRAFT_58102 [Rhizodiscina lignyota]
MASLQQPESGTTGPLCSSTSELIKAIFDIPATSSDAFLNSSDWLHAVISSTSNLAVYHTTASSASLLRILMALLHLSERRPRSPRGVAAVIIVDEWDRQHHFDHALALLRQHFRSRGVAQLKENAFCWGNVTLVRGLPTRRTGAAHQYSTNTLSAAAARVQVSISNTLGTTGLQGIVWHESASVTFLDHFLFPNVTSGRATTTFKAITITGPLYNEKGTSRWTLNTVFDGLRLQGLLAKATLHNIPFIFVEGQELGLRISRLRQLPRFASTWPALLPEDSWRERVRRSFNRTAVSIFQLHAAIDDCPTSQCVNKINQSLPNSASSWANECKLASNYRSCSVDRAKGRLSKTTGEINCPGDDHIGPLAEILLDPDRATGGLFAARVNIVIITQPVARPSSTSQIYILISTNQAATQGAFFAAWDRFITSMVPNPSAVTVARDVAGAWRDLCMLLGAELRYVERHYKYWSWSDVEKKALEQVVRMLEDGEMSKICKRSLS